MRRGSVKGGLLRSPPMNQVADPSEARYLEIWKLHSVLSAEGRLQALIMWRPLTATSNHLPLWSACLWAVIAGMCFRMATATPPWAACPGCCRGVSVWKNYHCVLCRLILSASSCVRRVSCITIAWTFCANAWCRISRQRLNGGSFSRKKCYLERKWIIRKNVY